MECELKYKLAIKHIVALIGFQKVSYQERIFFSQSEVLAYFYVLYLDSNTNHEIKYIQKLICVLKS